MHQLVFRNRHCYEKNITSFFYLIQCAEMCGHHRQDGGVGDVARGAEEAGGRTRLPTRHQGDQPSQTEARGHRKYKLHSYLT
jgi:hypothetical protein